MKKIFNYFAIFTIASLTFVSCSKEDADEKAPKSNPCANGNVCFKGNDIQYNITAEWFYMSAQRKYRINFTKSSGGVSNERLELDFVNGEGLKTGDYDFAGNILQDGSAALFYYKNDNGVISQVTCKTGTLKVLSVSGDKITATFTCAGEDQDRKAVTVTNGNAFEINKL